MPIIAGLPPLEITLRRTARARRFSLRVSRVDGRITLSMPLRARESEAMEFARAQEGWLRNALARMPQTNLIGIGSAIPVEGQMVQLVATTGRKIVREGDSLFVPGDPAQVGARVQAWLKALARDRLVAASDHHAAKIDRKVARVTLRDTRSRWGSCSHEGALMYSWRLVMAPPSVLSYVAAHEVAHMLEMNHSDRFWSVVARLFPGWQTERNWLHRHGGDLHALRFS